MKVAIIETGGKQYLIKEGDKIKIEKIKAYEKEENPKIIFNDVIFYADDNNFFVNKDDLKNIKVIGSLVERKKIKTLVWKYKPKTRYRKKKGYKKEIWLVRIESIESDSK